MEDTYQKEVTVMLTIKLDDNNCYSAWLGEQVAYTLLPTNVAQNIVGIAETLGVAVVVDHTEEDEESGEL